MELSIELDSQEIRLLQQIELLAAPSTKSKRKMKHTVFVDDDASGIPLHLLSEEALNIPASRAIFPS